MPQSWDMGHIILLPPQRKAYWGFSGRPKNPTASAGFEPANSGYVSLMYEPEKIQKVFTSKFVGAGPSSYKKRIYRAAVSQRLRNTGLQ